MKKLILIALIGLMAIRLTATESQSIKGMLKTVPRSYTQLLVNDTDGGELPGVINKSNATSPDYSLTAYITTHPQEVMSTDSTLATVRSHAGYIRVWRLGNGTTFPYVTCAYLQFGGFLSGWTTGDTIRFNLKHIPTGESTTWDIVIPDESTSAIGYKQNYDPIEKVVAPPWVKKNE